MKITEKQLRGMIKEALEDAGFDLNAADHINPEYQYEESGLYLVEFTRGKSEFNMFSSCMPVVFQSKEEAQQFIVLYCMKQNKRLRAAGDRIRSASLDPHTDFKIVPAFKANFEPFDASSISY